MFDEPSMVGGVAEENLNFVMPTIAKTKTTQRFVMPMITILDARHPRSGGGLPAALEMRCG